MDRSWMIKPRRDPAYKDGVDQFLSFAFRDLSPDSKISCPCNNCKNRITQNRDAVETHLKCDGILQGYTVWNHHGEEYDAPSFAFAHLPDNNENLPIPGVLRTATVDGHGRLDDMTGMLQAVFGMPANYESLSSMSETELGDGHSDCGNMDNVPEDENLPRPYESLHTVKDAIGRVVAWPRSRVKRPKSSTPR